MNCMRASSMWKKRLLASILPLSLLMAAPADNIPLFGPGHAIAAAVQEEAGAALSGDDEEKIALRAQYGENKRITTGDYDRSLAVKCINGTFVGKKTDNIIAYRGIPFVGKPPVGELRWKLHYASAYKRLSYVF